MKLVQQPDLLTAFPLEIIHVDDLDKEQVLKDIDKILKEVGF